MISRQTIEYVIKTIVEKYRPERVILFGSYASGEPDEASDLDLFLIKDTNLPPDGRTMEVDSLFPPGKYPCPMDVIVYTPAEVEYWRDVKASFVHQVLKTGKVVYG